MALSLALGAHAAPRAGLMKGSVSVEKAVSASPAREAACAPRVAPRVISASPAREAACAPRVGPQGWPQLPPSLLLTARLYKSTAQCALLSTSLIRVAVFFGVSRSAPKSLIAMSERAPETVSDML